MKKILKPVKGFTLIEMMIVIIIIGILAAISIPIYNNYTQSARAAEGAALVTTVSAAERVYFAGHGTYTNDPTQFSINAAGNAFFTSYTISGADATGFTVKSTSADGNITVTLVHNVNDTITTNHPGLLPSS